MENQNIENGINEVEGASGTRTFTQDDVNRIVGERLAKERSKSASDVDFTKRENELIQRELRMSAKELLVDKNLPTQLLEVLNCADEDTMKKNIEIIEGLFGECKVNAMKGITFKGFQPGSSMGLTESQLADNTIREAMGLNR